MGRISSRCSRCARISAAFFDAELGRDLISGAETDVADVASQATGVL
jgi:hypothetical protein